MRKTIIIFISIISFHCSCKQNVKNIRKCCEGKDNKEIYIEKTYYINGKLKKIATYKNGIRNGKEITFWENGKRSFEGLYTNDTINGECKEYYKNGKLRFQGQQKMGKLTGLIKKFYPNGSIEYEKEYKKDTSYIINKWDSSGNKIN